jgi:hypothetical protein
MRPAWHHGLAAGKYGTSKRRKPGRPPARGEPGRRPPYSCAAIEAQERGLADVLAAEFEPAPDALAGALTFCDMTTSPDGEHVSVDSRLAEIHRRYGPGHLVSRSIHRATPMILGAVDQVRMAARATRRPRLQLSRTRRARKRRAAPATARSWEILSLAGAGANWLPEWLPGPVR